MPKIVVTSDCTSATATGDTTETNIGSVTLPSNAQNIIGVGVSLGGAGLTTLETPAGIFRVSINNLDVTPAKFPFKTSLFIVTSGCAPQDNSWYPVNWGPAGNSVVTFYVTMDMTNTINPTARGYVLYEKLVA